LFLKNTILLAAPGTPQVTGILGDGGYNLSSDNSRPLTATGSRNNLDPDLGPLADNGGFIQTMALLPGSPAADAADPNDCPPTDARGVARPFNFRCDIGAYEMQNTPFTIRSLTRMDSEVLLGGFGPISQPFRVQRSTDLAGWQEAGSETTTAAGTFTATASAPGNGPWFYRLIAP
jgi:hypothetical protein